MPSTREMDGNEDTLRYQELMANWGGQTCPQIMPLSREKDTTTLRGRRGRSGKPCEAGAGDGASDAMTWNRLRRLE